MDFLIKKIVHGRIYLFIHQFIKYNILLYDKLC